MGRLFDTKETSKSSIPSAKKTTGRLFETPVTEKVPTLGSKVKEVGGEVVKAIVKPVATIVARPIQLGAELLGASDEAVNKFTQDKFGDWVAPTPQNAGDVVKDIGRGIQTVAMGLPTAAISGKVGGALLGGAKLTPTALKAASIGGKAITGAGEGAAFGLGADLEQGTNGQNTALGTVIGAGVPIIGPVISKVFGKSGKKVAENLVTKTSKTADTIVKETPIANKIIKEVSVKEQPVKTLGKDITNEVIPNSVSSTKVVPPDVIESGKSVLDNKFPERVGDNTHAGYSEAFAMDIESNPALVEQYASGQLQHPLGTPYNNAYNALLTNYASKSGDMALLDRVTNINFKDLSKVSGQALEANKLREKGTIADILRETKADIVKRFEETTGRSVEKDYTKFADDFKKEIGRFKDSIPTIEEINSIVQSLMCK